MNEPTVVRTWRPWRPVRDRMILSLSVALTLVAVLLGSLGGVAFAHTLSKTKTVHKSAHLCVKGNAKLKHARMEGVSYSYGGTDSFHTCSAEKRKPRNNIRVRLILSRHSVSSTSICKDTGWHKNPYEAAWWSAAKSYSSNAPCGPGDYTVTTNAYVYEYGWKGDIVYPGWHYFS